MRPVYLDYNATTPVDARVLGAMLPYFTEAYGNAGSIDHIYGLDAHRAVEQARAQVAGLVGAAEEEIVFTSGATESDNMAIAGVLGRAEPDAELVVSAIEHPAVLECAAQFGARARVVGVGRDGVIDPSEVRRHLTPKTALVSVMAANNETGAIQPIVEIGRVCAEAGVMFHTDAVQAAGRIPVDVDEANVSLLSLSAHKLHGPKGVGALYVRRRGGRAKLTALQRGGGQERNLRPGTINVPGVVGFGVAARIAGAERPGEMSRQLAMKDQLIRALMAIEDVVLNVPAGVSLAQTVSVRVAGVGARALMHATRDEIAFSSGSACSSTRVEPSRALLAQGLSAEQADQAIRLSFGRFTTEEHIALAGDALGRAARSLRRIAV